MLCLLCVLCLLCCLLCLLCCSAGVKIFANLETTERIYSIDNPGHMCIRDGYVCFYNSHLIRWALGW